MGRKKKKGLSKSIFLMQRVCVASILKEEKKKKMEKLKENILLNVEAMSKWRESLPRIFEKF